MVSSLHEEDSSAPRVHSSGPVNCHGSPVSKCPSGDRGRENLFYTVFTVNIHACYMEQSVLTENEMATRANLWQIVIEGTVT
jgi:hypothetical protein